jgi:uncharacterized membrane protein YfcA
VHSPITPLRPPVLAVGRALGVNLALVLLVWSTWAGLGGERAFASLLQHWQVTLTMVVGSFVGGATAEGGGAIAFPVFTKILGIPPHEARTFALAIQSIGMTSASVAILALRVPVAWPALALAAPAGILGLFASTFLLVPVASPSVVKVAFTLMVSSLAVALAIMNRPGRSLRRPALPPVGPPEACALLASGFVGGLFTGLVGTGVDIVTFMTLVLLFRLDEKVATPTTVLLMTLLTLVGFALHGLVLGSFTPVVQGYWLAAVPVVVVFAPLGAYVCARLPRGAVAWSLILLIAFEFASTILLVPMTPALAATAGGSLLLWSLINRAMCRSRRYALEPAK